MKTWEETLESAVEFVEFLKRDKLFDKPFNNTMNALVITDAKIGYEYCYGQDDNQCFPDWSIISQDDIFPDDFEFDYYNIDRKISANNYFDMEEDYKDLSGANEKWEGILPEKMIFDMVYIMHCYANDYFPPIWEKILQAYLNGGLPCGWSDFPPKGRLVVFSNE